MNKVIISLIILLSLFSCNSNYKLDKTNLMNIAIAIDSSFRSNDTILLNRILYVDDLGDLGDVTMTVNMDSIVQFWSQIDSVKSINKSYRQKEQKLKIEKSEKMLEIFDFFKRKPLLIKVDTVTSTLDAFNVNPQPNDTTLLTLFYKEGNDFFALHLPYEMSCRFVNKKRFVASDRTFEDFEIKKGNFNSYYYTLLNISEYAREEKNAGLQSNILYINLGYSAIISKNSVTYSWDRTRPQAFKEMIIKIGNQSEFDITFLKFQIVIRNKDNKEIIKQTIFSNETIFSGDITAIPVPNINMYHTGFDVSNKNNFNYYVSIIDFAPYPKDWTCASRLEDYLKQEALKLEKNKK